MLRFITKERKWIFAAGAAAGAVVLTLLKTKKIHTLAVKGVANGMMLKDKVLETAANIKEEADDICAEARASAQEQCACGCDCSEEE